MQPRPEIPDPYGHQGPGPSCTGRQHAGPTSGRRAVRRGRSLRPLRAMSTDGSRGPDNPNRTRSPSGPTAVCVCTGSPLGHQLMSPTGCPAARFLVAGPIGARTPPPRQRSRSRRRNARPSSCAQLRGGSCAGHDSRATPDVATHALAHRGGSAHAHRHLRVARPPGDRHVLHTGSHAPGPAARAHRSGLTSADTTRHR